MTTINTYLTFNGNCEKAFTFYKSIFGGEFPYVGRFKEMPNFQIAEEDSGKIMHISLPIGGETILMGSDTIGEASQNYKPGNNFSISIRTDTREEADRLFEGLSEGGEISMSMKQTFWGDYFGMLTDKFGINWMVSFDTNTENQ